MSENVWIETIGQPVPNYITGEWEMKRETKLYDDSGFTHIHLEPHLLKFYYIPSITNLKFIYLRGDKTCFKSNFELKDGIE